MTTPQQIQINPLQALQLCDQVLLQLDKYVDERIKKEPNNHKRHAITAHGSILHTRMLLNLRLRSLVQEYQAAEAKKREEALRKIPPKVAERITAAAVVPRERSPNDVDSIWKGRKLNDLIDLSFRH